jgi:hypothetical protein
MISMTMWNQGVVVDYLTGFQKNSEEEAEELGQLHKGISCLTAIVNIRPAFL